MTILGRQLAHQDEIEELGPIDEDGALNAFRAIPWEEQQQQAKELQICGPSLFLFDREIGTSILDSRSGESFFAGLLETDQVEFIVFFEYQEESEGWTLRGKRMRTRTNSMQSYGHDRAAVETAIRYFFADRPSLIKLIQGGHNSS
jgi:hypothetical protein